MTFRTVIRRTKNTSVSRKKKKIKNPNGHHNYNITDVPFTYQYSARGNKRLAENDLRDDRIRYVLLCDVHTAPSVATSSYGLPRTTL